MRLFGESLLEKTARQFSNLFSNETIRIATLLDPGLAFIFQKIVDKNNSLEFCTSFSVDIATENPLFGNHCSPAKSEYEEGLCRIGNDSYLTDVPAGCEELIGRLTLDHATNASELWKLYNITTIYGQLSIINSSIIGLSSLWKLKHIVNLSREYLYLCSSYLYGFESER
ncbi:unnamed protein product [Heligmosomoides polygyrus]|uniref:Recep_L_domain domain-containing protein n=1 Tax=Heligmosomoides polygyrus TaxID=6339 RepID=A0A183FU10_HELPZ|nr:unnamed protein product [Heligmosomoides polygyrus]